MSRRLKIAAILFILVFPSAVYVFLTAGKERSFTRIPYYGPKRPINIEENGKKRVDTIYYHIPGFKFYDQNGNTVTSKELIGHIWVAGFTSYNEDVNYPVKTNPKDSTLVDAKVFSKKDAPALAVMMNELEEKTNLDTALRLVTFTLDSENVKSLKDYANTIHITSKRRMLLSGNFAQLRELAMNGFYNPADTDIFKKGAIHLFLIDKEGCIRCIYNGLMIKELNNLIDDINMLEANYYIQNEKLHKEEHDKDAI